MQKISGVRQFNQRLRINNNEKLLLPAWYILELT